MEINEKSVALACQRRAKDLLARKEVLKTAVKVAESVKHPTLDSSTHFHTTVRIQMLYQRIQRVLFSDKWKRLQPIKVYFSFMRM